MNQDKKNTFWNAIAAIINALESVIILMVVSRVASLSIAGIITIGFSLANLFLRVGNFGTRNYQIVHEGQDISTVEFIKARIITTFGMLLCVLLYSGVHLFLHQYTEQKALIIVGVCFWYVVEAFEDVFLSSLQSRGRLDIGNMLFISRWIGIFISFIFIILLTKKILIAIMGSDLTALLIEVIALWLVNRKYPYQKWNSPVRFVRLLQDNIVLCLAGFSYFFITNIPKYAIDMYLADDMQAIYGYVSMPVFAIALLNNMIYQPQLTYYIDDLRKKRMASFIRRVKRQLVIIFFIMVIVGIGAYVLGIPILSFIYHTDLTSYKQYMMLSLVGSAFLAVGGYLSTVFVIMDERNMNMVLYAVVLAFGVAVTYPLTAFVGMKGAVYGYLLTMIGMAGLFGLSFIKIWKARLVIA